MWAMAALGAVHLAQQVDVDEPLHLVGLELLDGGVDADRGVVDPGVDAAEALHGALCQPLDLLAVGHVGDHDFGLPAQALDLCSEFEQCLLVARGEHHRGPPPRHLEGCLAPDALGRAGDHHHLVAE